MSIRVLTLTVSMSNTDAVLTSSSILVQPYPNRAQSAWCTESQGLGQLPLPFTPD